MSPPRVVILGSGYGGAHCARAIQKKLDGRVELTVIEKRRCNVHKIAASRAATLGKGYCERVLIPNFDLIKHGKGKLLHKTILGVNDKEVFLADDTTIPFDYLVCATGATNFSVAEPPLRYDDKGSMVKFYTKVSQKINLANQIVVVGGGPVGVEMAAEIKYAHPEKSVKVLHGGPSLISNCRPPASSKFREAVKSRLTELGVEVILNQRLDLSLEQYGNKPYISGKQMFKTDRGLELESDLVLLCTGRKLSNKIYPSDWKDSENGTIRVRRTLQLLDFQHIFAVGDINDFPENKQGVWAGRQGVVAAENIKRLVEDKGDDELKKYTAGFGTGKTFMFVSVGREKGASFLGYVSLGSSFTKQIKCKGLFTKEQWALYRQRDLLPGEIKGYKPELKDDDVKKEVFGPSGGPQKSAISPAQKALQQQALGTKHVSMASVASLSEMYDDDDEDDGGAFYRMSMRKAAPPQPPVPVATTVVLKSPPGMEMIPTHKPTFTPALALIAKKDPRLQEQVLDRANVFSFVGSRGKKDDEDSDGENASDSSKDTEDDQDDAVITQQLGFSNKGNRSRSRVEKSKTLMKPMSLEELSKSRTKKKSHHKKKKRVTDNLVMKKDPSLQEQVLDRANIISFVGSRAGRGDDDDDSQTEDGNTSSHQEDDIIPEKEAFSKSKGRSKSRAEKSKTLMNPMSLDELSRSRTAKKGKRRTRAEKSKTLLKPMSNDELSKSRKAKRETQPEPAMLEKRIPTVEEELEIGFTPKVNQMPQIKEMEVAVDDNTDFLHSDEESEIDAMI